MQIASPMKPTTATATRPNPILIALAAAWMILSLAIGGAVSAETNGPQSDQSPITETAQP
jgi:hypothetical protein